MESLLYSSILLLMDFDDGFSLSLCSTDTDHLGSGDSHDDHSSFLIGYQVEEDTASVSKSFMYLKRNTK